MCTDSLVCFVVSTFLLYVYCQAVPADVPSDAVRAGPSAAPMPTSNKRRKLKGKQSVKFEA